MEVSRLPNIAHLLPDPRLTLHCFVCACLIFCTVSGSGDVGGEYVRQRSYLEKTIESLKRKLAADSEAHRADELRIMSQNVTLIRELNELRREIKVRRIMWGVGGSA